MTLRYPLRQRILAAWSKCIKEDVDTRQVNSERSLQAALWFRLTKEFESDVSRKRRILIEPHISIAGTRCYPDLIICDSQRIIGIIELKYQPRREPSTDKDFRTLAALWMNREHGVGVTLRRHRGPDSNPKTFRLSRDLLMVWAGVHREVSPEQKSEILPEDPGCHDFFMRLHAETGEGNSAKISSFSSRTN